MEEGHGIDLTYVTERIITVSFPWGLSEQAHLENLRHITQMLQSKHGHNYLVINLSEKTDHLTQTNQKVLDTGWVEHLAPTLEQISSVCTTAESWLHSHPQHVLVLHCWGGRGRIGVLVASYIHFTSTSASADLALDHFSMRRFYNDQVSALMTPSQKRYVLMFGGLLKGGLRMTPSPSFLLCVILQGLPRLCPLGACRLFLRVYQNLQAVCTSAVYQVLADQTDRVYFVLQPAQLLKGDIMVVCYHVNSQSASRQVVFRLQFHTGIIHGHTLLFSKGDLDSASQDPRFQEDGMVELVFSESPEKMAGRELWQNGAAVTLDYNTLDPLVRRDSYHEMAVPHQLGPLDGSLYARVRKRSSQEGAPPTSPDHSDRTLSASDDSGLSASTQWTAAAAAARSPGREAGQDQRARARGLLSGLALELTQPPLEAPAQLPSPGAGEGGMAGEKAGLGQPVNGEDTCRERETDILDDNEDEDKAEASTSLDRPSSVSIGSLSSESLPEAPGLAHHRGYSTHTWVQQQQHAVDGPTTAAAPYPPTDRAGWASPERTPLLVAPLTPPRGKSSRAALERVAGLEEGPDLPAATPTTGSARGPTEEPCQQDELESLATDIDESIEQLNLLILDLDPTFVPVPTRSGSASLHANGLSHAGQARLAGWRQHQVNDVTNFPENNSLGWRGGGASVFKNSPTYSPSQASSQDGHVYPMDSVDSGRTTPLTDSSYIVPATPAFPVSPPTPYMKNFPEFSQLSTGRQWEGHRTSQDSRSFLDSMNHSGGSADADLFRPEVSVTPSCQRTFGSMRSVSSGSPQPHPDTSTPPPVWQARSFQPQPSPPLSLSSPNAHSSPRGAPRCLEARGGWREAEEGHLFSLLQGNGGLEHSLLEALEGLEGLGLGLGLGLDEGPLPPLLPEKRRGDGAELGSRSPSLSGYSSPHSGSSLSIPFPFSMSPEPHRGLCATPSPGADSCGGKHDTVKFVQDTSKFWYKPDISRDQAIAVLKDREPGFFIVRDSHSFRGAYGLAMKVDTPPPSVAQQNKKAGDLSNELVRHFLIECTSKGVRLKGCPNEPYFGSLTALVCQHSITPLALPCKLILPDRDPLEELRNSTPQTATNSAAELLKQGAACNVWYLGSVELESLTGHQAVQKAAGLTLAMEPPPTSTVVHFKVSAQGITLTDNQRKLFFRRHYTVNTVIFCSLDPQDRKWTRDGCSTAKIFGFVARKSQSGTENVCHLFAEHDPEQPASAIVNFVSKVMIGSQKSK
ncbi:tensin 3-2 [Aplochiton taeniatus]